MINGSVIVVGDYNGDNTSKISGDYLNGEGKAVYWLEKNSIYTVKATIRHLRLLS